MMQWYREFLPRRRWSSVLSWPADRALDRTLPERHLGQRRSAPWFPATAGRWRKPRRRSSHSHGTSAAPVRLDGADAFPGLAEPVRPAAAQGPAVVLERRFRQRTSGRGHRRASGARRQGAQRTVADASVSDRRRRPPRRAKRDGLELPGCDVVHGHRGHRSRPAQGRGDNAVGQGHTGKPCTRITWAAPM